MNEIKSFIIDYIEENQEGTIDDIIRSILEEKFYLDDLKQLKKIIEETLEELKTKNLIDFLPTSQTFHSTSLTERQTFSVRNEFGSYQIILSGTLWSSDNTYSFDYRKFHHFLEKRIASLGHYQCITADNEKQILSVIFETPLLENNLHITKRSVIIKSYMKSLVDTSEPIINYTLHLPNRSMKKRNTAFIPLNFGVYLFFDNLIHYLRLNYNNLTLDIDSINFIE